MSLACIHTHTVFCDGHDDIETNCLAAYEKGLSSLGFSAHAPVTRKTGLKTDWHLPDEKLNEYIDSVMSAQKRWKGKLPVFLGLEVDFISGLMGPSDKEYRDMGLDYIIGSVHYVLPPRGEPFTVDHTMESLERNINLCYGGDVKALVESYWQAEEAMINSGGFDLLGHPDLIKKNNKEDKLFSENESLYISGAGAIAALTAKAGIPAELNSGGMIRSNLKECYPSLGFLRLFHEHGVPMVINADAHRASELGGHYDDARKAMLAAGYTETLIFTGRENGKAKWRVEKL